MGWTTPRDYVANEVLTAAILNVDHRDNLDVLSTHAHSNAAGNGSSTLGNLVKTTFTDASAPSAPGSGLTVLYTVSGRPHYRAGSSGSDTALAIIGDVHAQTHASAHQPGGADAMAVDAATSTGSLRTLGTGSTQGAAGNHTHAANDEVAGTGANYSDASVTISLNKGTGSGNIAIGAAVTVATKTISPGVTSRIWGGGYCHFQLIDANNATIALDLLIDGTQVATTNFGTGISGSAGGTGNYFAHVAGAAAEGSGSKVVLIRIRNVASDASATCQVAFTAGVVCGAMKASS